MVFDFEAYLKTHLSPSFCYHLGLKFDLQVDLFENFSLVNALIQDSLIGCPPWCQPFLQVFQSSSPSDDSSFNFFSMLSFVRAGKSLIKQVLLAFP